MVQQNITRCVTHSYLYPYHQRSYHHLTPHQRWRHTACSPPNPHAAGAVSGHLLEAGVRERMGPQHHPYRMLDVRLSKLEAQVVRGLRRRRRLGEKRIRSGIEFT
jgi:hypothetical protein